MRVLIIGSKGQLGHDLMQQSRVRRWEAAGADLPECDITSAESLKSTLQQTGGVDAVVNASAYTAVDAAESDEATAFAVNRDGVGTLAGVCRDNGIPLVHVSTDYVFDGIQTRPYEPTDCVNPTGVYGRSKAEGEAMIREQLNEHIIVRTSWLFGLHGANFVKTMIRLGKERESLRIVDDQVGCPTYAGDLAGALLDATDQAVSRKEGWGTYHFCNEVAVTWYAFARRILSLARAYEPLRVSEILPVLTSGYPTPAPRPPYSVLDCTSFEKRFGTRRRPWEEALKEMLSALYE